jgi:hypothetical protein
MNFPHFVIDDEQINKAAAMNADGAFLKKVELLRNATFDTPDSFWRALTDTLGPSSTEMLRGEVQNTGLNLCKAVEGGTVGYAARGYLGQYLVVYPEKRLVAVRQIRGSQSYDANTDGFVDFFELVKSVLPNVLRNRT